MTVALVLVSVISFASVVIVFNSTDKLGHTYAGLIALAGAIICFLTLYFIIERQPPHFNSEIACVRVPKTITAQPAQSKYVSLPTVHVDEEI